MAHGRESHEWGRLSINSVCCVVCKFEAISRNGFFLPGKYRKILEWSQLQNNFGGRNTEIYQLFSEQICKNALRCNSCSKVPAFFNELPWNGLVKATERPEEIAKIVKIIFGAMFSRQAKVLVITPIHTRRFCYAQSINHLWQIKFTRDFWRASKRYGSTANYFTQMRAYAKLRSKILFKGKIWQFYGEPKKMARKFLQKNNNRNGLSSRKKIRQNFVAAWFHAKLRWKNILKFLKSREEQAGSDCSVYATFKRTYIPYKLEVRLTRITENIIRK